MQKFNPLLHINITAEQVLESLSDTTRAGMTILNPSGKIVYANLRAEKILGLQKDEITSRKYNDPLWTITDLKGGEFPAEKLPFALVSQTRKAVTDIRHAIRWPDGKIVYLSINAAPILDQAGNFQAVAATIEDISATIKAEEKLTRSEQRINTIFNQAAVGIAEIGPDGMFINPNQRFCEILGYHRDELIGRNIRNITLAEDLPLDEKFFNDVASGKRDNFDFEKRCIHKDGHPVWIHLYSNTIRDDAGKPLYAIASIVDIMEQKRAEQELIASRNSTLNILKDLSTESEARRLAEQQFQDAYNLNQMIIETSPVGIWMYKEAGQTILVNQAGVALGGGDYEKLISLNFRELESWKKTGMLDAAEEALNSGDPIRKEVHAINTLGTEVWYEALMTPVRYKGAKHLLLMTYDIKDRMHTEMKLRESEERLRLVTEATNDGIFDWNLEGKTVYFNPTFFTMLGYEPHEFPQSLTSYFDLLHPDDRQKSAIQLSESIVGEKQHSSEELRFRAKNDEWRWILSRSKVVKRAPDGKPLRIVGTNVDISERKGMEESIRESEERYRLLADNSHDMISLHDQEGKYIYASPASQHITGFSSKELIGRDSYEFFHPDDIPVIQKHHAGNLSGTGKSAPIDYRIHQKDGRYRWVQTLSKSFLDKDGNRLILATTRDISDIKVFEIALKNSEKQYRQLFDTMLDAFALHEIILDDSGKPVDYRFITVNPAFEKLTGLRRDQIIDKTVLEILPGTEPYWIELYGEVALSGNPRSFQNFSAELNHYYEGIAYSPEPLKFAVVFQDISKQHLAKLALQQSESMLAASQKIAKVGGWEYDVESRKIFWTDETYRIHEYDKNQFPPGSQEHITRSIECYHPEDREAIRQAFEKCCREGTPYDLEFPFKTARGRKIWIRTSGQPVYEEDKIIKVVGTIQDITERKQNEDNLKKRNEYIQTILDNLPIGLAVNNIDSGAATYMNEQFEKIYGWPGEIIKDVENFFKYVYPDPEYRKKLQTRVMADIRSGDPQRMQWEGFKVTRQNGSLAIIAAKNIPLPEQNLMISTVQDITERSRSLEKLQDSERRLRALAGHLQTVREDERKAIAREIHDEIAQIMTALKIDLSIFAKEFAGKLQPDDMQRASADIQAMKELIDSTIRQIRALIHRLRPETLETLGLIEAMRRYSADFGTTAGTAVHFSYPKTLSEIPTDSSLAIYRIFQEALSNISRHARASRAEIRLSVSQSILILSISDDGKGMNPEVQNRSDSFGIIGMKERAILLGGELAIHSQPGRGTELILRLPLD